MPIKILTIDDERLVRRSLVGYLEDSSYEVFEADGAEKGIAILDGQKIDVVLIDLNMPGMNGKDFIQQVRKTHPFLPLIVISGIGALEKAIDALRIGAWDYLTKPINEMKVLEQVIQNALEKSRILVEHAHIRSVLEDDQEAGRLVQQKLLPKPINTRPLTIEHSVIPSVYLSGDSVDYIEFGKRYLLFYLADVSGHGAAAAFVTVLIKNFFREWVGRYEQGYDDVLHPEKILTRLNQEIYDARLGKYLTMLYFILDKEQELLSYVVCGHYPNPILIQEDIASFLPGDGYPVGMKEKNEYKSNQIRLRLPYEIVLFSDGIMELLEGDMDKREQQLLKILEKTGTNIQEICRYFRLPERKDRPDDVSILCLSRRKP